MMRGSLCLIVRCVARKTPGTEDGVLDPIPTFSTCYSAPFIVLHVRSCFYELKGIVSDDLRTAKSLRNDDD